MLPANWLPATPSAETGGAGGGDPRREDRMEGRAAAERSCGSEPVPKDAPPEKFRRLNDGEQKRAKNRKARLSKRVATWKFPAFSSDERLVWF